MNPTAVKFLGAFLITLSLAAAVSGVVQSRRLNPAHRATTIIQIERDDSDLPGFESGMPASADMNYILSTEAALIPSEFILDPVIEQLGLNSIWGDRYNDRQKLKTAESRDILKGCLMVTPVAGLPRIQITVTREAQEDVLKIANAVAQTYCDYRKDRRRKIAEKGLAAIAEPIKNTEAKWVAAQKKLTTAQAALPADLRSNPPALSPDGSKAMSTLQARHNSATIQLLSLSNQLQSSTQSKLPDTNSTAKIRDEISRLQSELTSSKDAINTESRRVEALRSYWSARDQVETAGKLFAPYKKMADDIQSFGASSNKPPASIVERAEKAIEVGLQNSSAGYSWFFVSGGLLLAGLGIVLSNRTRVVVENQKAS